MPSLYHARHGIKFECSHQLRTSRNAIPASFECQGDLSCKPTQPEQFLAGGEVGILIGLRLGRKRAVSSPEIDQWLHGLKLVRPKHIEGGSGKDEVAKAAVELLLEVQVVERLGEVRPVKVCVDAEHLAEDGLADLDKVLREARALADPVGLTGAGELRERRSGDAGVVCVGDA